MKYQVKKSDIEGLGVFATQDIEEGEVVLCDPMLTLPSNITHSCELQDYVFATPFEYRPYDDFLALGASSLLNHGSWPNLDYDIEWDDGLERVMITLTATRHISEGDELTIDYGYDPMEEEEE